MQKFTTTLQHHSTQCTGTTQITIAIAMGAKLQKDMRECSEKENLSRVVR